MDKADIKKVIHNRFSKLEKSYDHLTGNRSFEAIHDFRVEIKKLRALLRLLSTKQVHQIKIQKDLKEIYAKSGVVRELQLVVEAKKEKGLDYFFPGCEESLRMKKAKEQLAGCMHHHQIGRAEEEIMEKIAGKITNFDIQRFFRKKFLKVQQLLNRSSLSDEQLHEIRKLLKDLLYTAQILENELSICFHDITWNKNRETYFSAITANLGKYHDLVVNHEKEKQASLTSHHWIKNADADKDRLKNELLDSLRKNLFSRYPLAPVFSQH